MLNEQLGNNFTENSWTASSAYELILDVTCFQGRQNLGGTYGHLTMSLSLNLPKPQLPPSTMGATRVTPIKLWQWSCGRIPTKKGFFHKEGYIQTLNTFGPLFLLHVLLTHAQKKHWFNNYLLNVPVYYVVCDLKNRHSPCSHAVYSPNGNAYIE